jgi:hypothetical protein
MDDRMKQFATSLVTILLLCVIASFSANAETLVGREEPDYIVGIEFPALAPAGLSISAAGDTLRSPESYGARYRFLRTFLEIQGFNVIMTLFGKYIMEPDGTGFNVSWESIVENLHAGMEWDDNQFSTNNFRHPYQGAIYFMAARDNHYDFYQSSMFSFLGATLWEYTGEAHHPAVNDWLLTSLGGISWGEMLYRFSDMVVDNTATGSGRAWRELGCLAIAPMREVNRLITGAAFDVHANPPDKMPASSGGEFRVGTRTLGEERLWTAASTKLFIGFDYAYNEMFEELRGKPFDYFDFALQLNFDNRPHGLGRMQIRGLLYGDLVSDTEKAQHMLGSFLHFDYFDNEAYTFGGQSLGACYVSRFFTGEAYTARTELHANVILLGADKSDYFNISRREYNYGPGFNYRVGASFGPEGRDVFLVAHEGSFIRSISGTVSDHYVNFTRLRLNLPIKSFLNLGAEYLLYVADRNYRNYPDVYARNPELMLYLFWSL